MGFCHIAPTKFLDLVDGYQEHLTLAHLVESDEEYTKFYREQVEEHDSMIIMDNSAFEMYKQNRPMYDNAKLIEMGEKVKASYIALSDYPGQHADVTIQAAIDLAPKFRDAGFGTFFIPQGEIGDVDQLVESFLWAAESEHVDYIGYSILAIPNAYGVERDNKLQRYVARFRFIQELKQNGFFEKARFKKHHFLGMVDGPSEISLVNEILPYNIDTWDSSAAVWAGLNKLSFDDSPTGLINGKFEKEVDFNHTSNVDPGARWLAARNMIVIDELWEQSQRWR